MGDTFIHVAQYVIKSLVLGPFWLQVKGIQFKSSSGKKTKEKEVN